MHLECWLCPFPFPLDVPPANIHSTAEHHGARFIPDTRHLPILEALRGQKHVSQRTLGERLGLAPSQVNRLIRQLLEADHLEVVDPGVRPFAYRLTPGGQRYLRRLSRDRYEVLADGYREMRRRIRQRLREVRDGGIRRIVFYGAGEVMEVTLPLARELGLDVVAVVDDDPDKQGGGPGEVTVDPPDSIQHVAADAVLITTFRHGREIRDRLERDPGASVEVLEL